MNYSTNYGMSDSVKHSVNYGEVVSRVAGRRSWNVQLGSYAFVTSSKILTDPSAIGHGAE